MSEGLRARKKTETRQRISDTATMLFMARGFDAVTVAEVAEAANVSKMTVFNYFPRKEGLFFDRIPEAAEQVTEAIRGRRAGETLLEALRCHLLEMLDQRHPLAGVSDGFPSWLRVALNSPSLLARAREAVEELENLLAELLAEDSGTDPRDPDSRMAAALIVAACRAVHVTAARRLLAGERADDIIGDQRRQLNLAFDRLGRALEG